MLLCFSSIMITTHSVTLTLHALPTTFLLFVMTHHYQYILFGCHPFGHLYSCCSLSPSCLSSTPVSPLLPCVEGTPLDCPPPEPYVTSTSTPTAQSFSTLFPLHDLLTTMSVSLPTMTSPCSSASCHSCAPVKRESVQKKTNTKCEQKMVLAHMVTFLHPGNPTQFLAQKGFGWFSPYQQHPTFPVILDTGATITITP